MTNILFILILPLITLFASFLFRAASGPIWQYSDPCYVYLFNAIQLVKGHSPTDYLHPGTPLQILIASAIWILNLGHSAAEAVNHVLLNPEFHLRVVFVFLAICSFLTSIILGIYVYRKTNDKLAVVLTQLMQLSFLILPSYNNEHFPILPVIANVSPEAMFISILNLFNLFLLGLYFSEKKSQELRYVLLLGLVCGLGLAVKLNFIFVLLSALLIVPLRKKLIFIVVCVMSFVLCTIPIIGKYPQFFHWISDMVGHSSRYGTGSEKIIDWHPFFLYFKLMIHFYWFFIYLAFGLWVWSSVYFFHDRRNRKIHFIWVLTLCALLHFAATAKYFSFHYLLPGFGLFSSIFLLFYLSFKTQNKILKPLSAAFILIFISVCVCHAIPYYKKLRILSQDIHDFNDKITATYPACTIIPSTTGDVDLFLDEQEALHRADGTVYRLESDDLFRLFPGSYYFFSEEVTAPETNVESYGIWNYKQRVWGDDVINTCPCAIFIKYNSDFSDYPYQVRLLDQSKYLSAFLLINSTEKQANEFFSQAMDSFNNGDYQKALILGLKAKQLNYEPKSQLIYILTIIYHDLLKSRGL